MIAIRNIYLAILCCSLSFAATCQSTASFEEMATKMAKGKVPDVEVADISEHLGEYLIIDARELAEYNVSHIPGAIWVGFDDFNEARIPDTDKPIIVYCSVGYRSERVGEKLLQANFEAVYNLRGSLFKWANEKLPMVDRENKPTVNIHGYNKKWGKWIKEGVILYE